MEELSNGTIKSYKVVLVSELEVNGMWAKSLH